MKVSRGSKEALPRLAIEKLNALQCRHPMAIKLTCAVARMLPPNDFNEWSAVEFPPSKRQKIISIIHRFQ